MRSKNHIVLNFFGLLDKHRSSNYTDSPNNLSMLIGETETGDPIWMDMERNPHLLIAGTTGSGKSSAIQVFIANTLLHSRARIFIVDTKGVEFRHYPKAFKNVSVIDNYMDARSLLRCLIQEMEYRYEILRQNNFLPIDSMHPLLCIIDEFADLIIQDEDKSLYRSLLQLTQKCRASRIHCILATQRPSRDILNPSIKANFPARIACQVGSGSDSRIILDRSGAEKLPGAGRAIIRNYNHNLIEYQGAYTIQEEVVEFVSSRRS